MLWVEVRGELLKPFVDVTDRRRDDGEVSPYLGAGLAKSELARRYGEEVIMYVEGQGREGLGVEGKSVLDDEGVDSVKERSYRQPGSCLTFEVGTAAVVVLSEAQHCASYHRMW